MSIKLPPEAKEAFKVVSSTSKSKDNGVLGHIWWDGKSVKCSIPSLMSNLKSSTIAGLTITDGYEFFKKIPLGIRGPYVTVEKIK